MQNISSRELYHQISNADFAEVGAAAHQIAETMSRGNEDVTIAGSGVLFILLCERFDLEPPRVFEYVKNMITREADKYPVYIHGLKDYLRYEF